MTRSSLDKRLDSPFSLDGTDDRKRLLSLLERTRRDALLEAIAMSARALLSPDDRSNAIQNVLALVGAATGVDRAQLFEVGGQTEPAAFRITAVHTWSTDGFVAPTLVTVDGSSFSDKGLESWATRFASDEMVSGHTKDFAPSVVKFLSASAVLSVAAVPVFLDEHWWGVLAFESCQSEREWLAAEIDTLKILAQLMGAAAANARQQSALADATQIIENSPTVLYRLSTTPPFPLIFLSQNIRQYGYEADALLASPEMWAELVEPADLAKTKANLMAMINGRREIVEDDFSFKRPDGSTVWFGGQSHTVRDASDRLVAIEGILTDITERKQAAERLAALVRMDAVTGLPNRTAFLDRLNRALARSKRLNTEFAVLYLDIDRFKDVNDSLGHPVGDMLLRTVANRLRNRIRDSDMVARFGGDEFAVLLEDVVDKSAPGAVAAGIGSAVSAPITVAGNELHVTVSIGVVPCDSATTDAEAILTKADLALYRAKGEGRDCYRMHVPALDQQAQERMLIANDLHGAVGRAEFELIYQPQVDLGSRRIVGLEALIRWNHPTRGRLLPDLFIPIAESNGTIREIGRWVLERGCKQIRSWRDRGIVTPIVAMNVSAAQFQAGERLDRIVAETIARHQILASELELELTESVLMTATQQHRDTFDRLRHTGIRLAIDDFGTGFSSLAYLTSFRVSRLKLAGRFIEAADTNAGDAAIVRATLRLASELAIDVVVEGVSTDA